MRLRSRRRLSPGLTLRSIAYLLSFYIFSRTLWKFVICPFISSPSQPYEASGASKLAKTCPHLPELDDVLVVMKTGATEALDRLPVHFHTTLRCMPHYIVYSDFAEVIDGHQVHDALDEISHEIKSTVPEFALYNALKSQGRSALSPDQLKQWDSAQNGIFGKQGNMGWHLDKWKFLPLVEKAMRRKPDAKWYIFVETDTYISWLGLTSWLKNFDHREEWYLGEQMEIGPTIFAYGGTGYMISAPTARKVVKYWKEYEDETSLYTEINWAGDEILGRTLKQVGIGLHWSWPNLQGDVPGEVDYNANAWGRRLWCYAAVSWHHMSSADIFALDQFERGWDFKANGVLRHSDVFTHYIYPQIASMPERDDWDNLSDFPYRSPEDIDFVLSFNDCYYICESQEACMQFSYAHGVCYISAAVKLGHKVSAKTSKERNGMRSGWMTDRIQIALETVPECDEGEWVLPGDRQDVNWNPPMGRRLHGKR